MTDRNKSIILLAAAVLLGCISIGVCLAVTVTSGVLSPQPGPASSAAGGPGNLYVEYILDASYSMNDPLSDGKKKVDAARERLSHSLKAYPPEVNLGLRVYGHRIPYLGREQESCTDIEQVAPAAPGYQGEIVTWLRDFEAQGMTPIGIALYQASKDLSQEPGKVNSIVLISDGQETCGVDPCLMVEKLRASGFRITVYVIGLKVDDPTRQQLTCIARAGGGVYQDVQSDVELQQALDQVQTEIEKNQAVAVAPATPTPVPPVAPAPPTLVPTTATTITPTLGIGLTQVNPIDGMLMVYVPAGKFLMGMTESDADKMGAEIKINMAILNDEEIRAIKRSFQQHTVYLDAYWIYQTEVTNAMYAQCVAAGACQPEIQYPPYPRDSYYYNPTYTNYPVVNVDWNQANTYCGWAEGRLPSEAEWEKAARGTDGRTYPWGEGIDCNKTNYGCGAQNMGAIRVVGSYPQGASPYGALDMAGNVIEWVADWFDFESGTYYASSPSNNPLGPDSGETRVVRGGSWNDVAGGVRTSYRYGFSPDGVVYFIGFRCVRLP